MTESTETIMFAEKIPVTVLKFRRDKHDFELGWEKPYLLELISTLKDGMVVFDIGAEQGEFTAMAAKIVGCENVHIFEPSKEYWPNIKALWDANGFDKVGGCFNGYVNNIKEFQIMFGNIELFGWPIHMGAEIYYGTHHANPDYDKNEEISIDTYCKIKGALPDVILMDIEGAELLALRGALKTIEKCSPIFFISIHVDEMINQRSNGSRQDIHDLFKQYGYNSKHINTDHEEHWKFYK